MPIFIDVFHGFYRTAIVPTFIDIVPFLINIVPTYNLFLWTYKEKNRRTIHWTLTFGRLFNFDHFYSPLCELLWSVLYVYVSMFIVYVTVLAHRSSRFRLEMWNLLSGVLWGRSGVILECRITVCNYSVKLSIQKSQPSTRHGICPKFYTAGFPG